MWRARVSGGSLWEVNGLRPTFFLGSRTSSVFEFLLQECVHVLDNEEIKGKISS